MTWDLFLAQHAWRFGGLAALLVFSGFFSGSETALFNLSRAQLYRIRSSHSGGRIVTSLMSDPRRLLNTLLLSNLLVNTAFASFSALIVFDLGRRGLTGWALGAAWAVPLIVLILIGEVVPKMLAFLASERWSLLAAPPLTVIAKILSPLVLTLQAVLVSPLSRLIAPAPGQPGDITADELAALLDLSAKRGIVDLDANALLQEIVELTSIRVGDIMTPRVDMIAHNVNSPRADLTELFKRTRLARIPVYEGDLDHVLGLVHAKRFLLNPDTPLAESIAEAPFVPVAANLERLLLQFRATRTQVAFVVDEYGGTAGIVTLHDLLEEIVGDIPDASAPRAPAVQRLSEREYLLDGDLAVHEWTDTFKTDLAERRVSTVGGFVTSLLGRIAGVGDVVSYRNLRFTVLSMRRRRIGKMRLELSEDQT